MLRRPPLHSMRFPLLIAAFLVAALVFQSLRTDDGRALDEQSGVSGEASEEAGPVRILPGSATAADWLSILLEKPGRVVALPEQVETYSIISKDPDTWAQHERFPKFDAENIMGFRPDLVLTAPSTDAAMVARVRKGGIRVQTVTEPTSWQGLLAVGQGLAMTLERDEVFESIRASLNGRRQALEERVGKARLRVLPYMNFGGGAYTAGSDTTLDLALRLAGYVNVAADLGVEGSGNVTAEMILSGRVDALLVSGTDGVSQSVLAAKGNPVLASVPAVAEGRFIMVSELQFSAGSHVILETAEEIARQGDAMEF